jgi:predicted RNA-binding Zn-ribbon protein involved in translation (DUF1610 family)
MARVKKEESTPESIEEGYNSVVFGDAYHDKATIPELKEEMEVRGLNPVLFTEKAFLLSILKIYENVDGRKISLKEAKAVLEKCIKKGNLQRWGDQKLIATNLFLNYRESVSGNINIDITQLEDEVHKDVSLVCPYCENTNVDVEPKKTKCEYTCPKCNKTFLAVIGIARAARGLGGYVAQGVVIRIENIEGGESAISYFSTHEGLDVRSGDLIAAVYGKGLFGGYGNKPSLIQNFNLGTYAKKL